MPKKKFLKIIKQREDLVSSAPQYFVDQLEKIQNDVYGDLLMFIKEMDTKGAKLEASTFNITQANRLRVDIRKWLKKHGYYQELTAFGKKYNDVIDLNEKYYESMGLDEAFTKRDLANLSKIKKDDLDFLLSRDKNVVNITYNEVINSVYNKSGWRGLADRLKTLHTDTVLSNGTKLNGLLKKYNSTYAFTAFAGFDRRIQTIKAEEYGMDKFYFSGSLVMDSREFCTARVDKVFTRKQVESWQKVKWRGKAEGRDVWTYLGGWNCAHLLSPVTDEMERELSGRGAATLAGEDNKYVEKYYSGTDLDEIAAIKKHGKDMGIEWKGLGQINNYENYKKVNIRIQQLLDEGYKINIREINFDDINSKWYAGVWENWELRLNKIYFENNDNFVNKLKNDVSRKWFAEGCDSLESIITHEMGHSMASEGFIEKNVYEQFKKIHDQYHKKLEIMDNKYFNDKLTKSEYNLELGKIFISDYATNNGVDEFIAESFSSYKHTKKPSPFAIKIGKLIDKYFKK